MYSLGIEFSTQSVKIVALDLEEGCVAFIDSFHYDSTFPWYETQGGVLPSKSLEIRHTSPFMLLEAIDFCFSLLIKSRIDPSQIKVVKVDGMQHCSVYVNNLFQRKVTNLNPNLSLLDQLRSCITRQTAPIWEDRSTIEEAEYLTKALRERGGISRLTGNRAELRFPAAQILKWAKEFPIEYENTSHVFVLSAFITSILSGKIAPVDTGDGWGTNLNHLDIDHPGWNKQVLSVVDAYLAEHGLVSPIAGKLGNMDHYDAGAGNINPYFIHRYGMDSQTLVLTGTGDNPATLLGCGGNMVVSLGSSYTVNGVMKQIVPSLNEEYNIFGYTRGRAMALSVFTNGGKVHESFFSKYMSKTDSRRPNRKDWEVYMKKAGSLQLSVKEYIMLPYFLDESVPLRGRGVVREGFSEADDETNIRALMLSQVLALKRHSSQLGTVSELCVVGGGADNDTMMQWIADAFNAETYKIENAMVAAPMGCALSGAVSALGISYIEAAARFLGKDGASMRRPIQKNVVTMRTLIDRYAELEERR